MQGPRYYKWLLPDSTIPGQPHCVKWEILCAAVDNTVSFVFPLIYVICTLLFLVVSVQTLGRLSMGPYQMYQFPYTVTYLALRNRGPLLIILCLMATL